MLDDITSFISHYLPYGALILCVSMVGHLITTIGFSRISPTQPNPAIVMGVISQLAAAVAALLAYFWLVDHRRLGWVTLVIAFALSLCPQLLTSSALGIIETVVGFGVALYLLSLVRGDYAE